MNTDLESQVVELEVRFAYQEDLLNELNKVVAKQDAELLLVKEQMRVLLKRIEEMAAPPAGNSSLETDERPPHY